MFNFDRIDLQRMTVSALGAAALSATCILGVAGPARAETPRTTADWQRSVEHQLDDRSGGTPFQATIGDLPATDLALTLSTDGRLLDARVAKSSGSAGYDAAAMQVAHEMIFPALPGGARTVRMHILHGATADQLAAARAKGRRTVTYAQAAPAGTFRIAAK